MKKKLNTLLTLLGISASIVGFIGFSQNNDTLFPIAFVLFIAAIIVYGILLKVK